VTSPPVNVVPPQPGPEIAGIAESSATGIANNLASESLVTTANPGTVLWGIAHPGWRPRCLRSMVNEGWKAL
jgi:hypothetical protein